MKYTPYLILSASFLGIGFAITKDCVILEESSTIGNEFAASLCQKPAVKIPVSTVLGKNFEKELASRKFLNENGEIYTQSAVFLLSDFLLRANREIHLDTVVTHIEKQDNGFTVTYFNNEGEQQIFAEKVIDTTSCGVFHTKDRKKYAFALTNKGEVQNEITGLSYISVPFDDNWIKTRETLLQKSRQEDFSILLTANEFCCTDPYEPEETDGIVFAPSDGFYNPLAAFEGGASLAEKI